MYIDRQCHVCGREWQGHLVGPCPFCQIAELEAENAKLRPYAPVRCIACGHTVAIGATKPAEGGRICVDDCVFGCHMKALAHENAMLRAGYSPACEGCKTHSGAKGVHWCDECVCELNAEVARLREAFRRYAAGEIRVEYGRHDVKQKAAYWGFDVRFWNGVTIPRQAVGPYAEPLKAALAVIVKGGKP